jgi:hypothetical protein
MQCLGVLADKGLLLMSKAWANGSGRGWRETRKRIIQRDQVCQLCGMDEGQMHVDHIIPKSKNGSDEDSNLRLLCRRCNLRRGANFFEHDIPPRPYRGTFTPTNVSISHE